MANMFFDTEEAYIFNINELLKKCDICELDKFFGILVKHFWPKTY